MLQNPLQAIQQLFIGIAVSALALVILGAIFIPLGARSRVKRGAVVAALFVCMYLYFAFGLLDFLRLLATVAGMALLFSCTRYRRYRGYVESALMTWTVIAVLAVIGVNLWIRRPPTVAAICWTLGLASASAVAGYLAGSRQKQVELRLERDRHTRAVEADQQRQQAEARALDKERHRADELKALMAQAEAKRAAAEAERARQQHLREEAEKQERQRVLGMEQAEKAALAEALRKEADLGVKAIAKRRLKVLEDIYVMSRGRVGHEVRLLDLASKAKLTPGQILLTLHSLQAGGNVRLRKEPDRFRKSWTKQSVALSNEGLKRVEWKYEPGRKTSIVNNEFHDKVIGNVGNDGGQNSIGFIGDRNVVDHVYTTNSAESEAFDKLLRAISTVREQVGDPYQAELLTNHELAIRKVGTAGTAEEKRSALDRLYGAAEALGRIASPILEAANGLKDVLG